MASGPQDGGPGDGAQDGAAHRKGRWQRASGPGRPEPGERRSPRRADPDRRRGGEPPGPRGSAGGRGPRRGESGRGDRDRRGQDEDRRREGANRGPRSWDRDRANDGSRREPEVPEDITGKELDRAVWTQLRTLTKENAEGVARHLVAAARLLEEDPDGALLHAEHAARRAGRVAGVREALGLVRYHRGEYADALREFRTARRLSGSDHLLPYLVDCERGLGRPEHALELASSAEARRLPESDAIELAIVVSGIRRDLGQLEAAVVGLRIPALKHAHTQPWAARLMYAYADAVLASGDEGQARDWFARASEADAEGETDAAERLDELDGVIETDLGSVDEDSAEDSSTP